MPSGQVSDIPWKVLNKRSNWFIQLMDIFCKREAPSNRDWLWHEICVSFSTELLDEIPAINLHHPKNGMRMPSRNRDKRFFAIRHIALWWNLISYSSFAFFCVVPPLKRPWVPCHANNPMSAGKCTPPATFVIDIRATWLCHTVRTKHGRCPISLRMFAFRLRSLDF